MHIWGVLLRYHHVVPVVVLMGRCPGMLPPWGTSWDPTRSPPVPRSDISPLVKVTALLPPCTHSACGPKCVNRTPSNCTYELLCTRMAALVWKSVLWRSHGVVRLTPPHVQSQNEKVTDENVTLCAPSITASSFIRGNHAEMFKDCPSSVISATIHTVNTPSLQQRATVVHSASSKMVMQY